MGKVSENNPWASWEDSFLNAGLDCTPVQAVRRMELNLCNPRKQVVLTDGLCILLRSSVGLDSWIDNGMEKVYRVFSIYEGIVDWVGVVGRLFQMEQM